MTNEATEVLVVDDDVDYCVSLGLLLTGNDDSEYRPTLCHTAQQAIELCLVERYDCVLMGYKLNHTTGAAVMEKLRESLGEKTPPVIIMAFGGSEDAVIDSLRARATDYLLKGSVNQQSLGRSIQNAVKQGQLQRGIQGKSVEQMMQNIELERRANEIQRFYHAVSHEMKTPLTATREFVSIVADGLLGPVNDQQLAVLEDALICCDQITTQFNDLIDLTRLETGKLRLNIVSSPPTPLMNRAIAINRKSAEERGISLEYLETGNVPNVLLDDGRISQVINNLLNNAIKFTDSGGRVRLSLKATAANMVQIRVTDTGNGIPKAYLSDIFTRLYQIEANNSTNFEPGLGLGLSVAQEIAKGHGSQLKVRSSLGIGSSFCFTLKAA